MQTIKLNSCEHALKILVHSVSNLIIIRVLNSKYLLKCISVFPSRNAYALLRNAYSFLMRISSECVVKSMCILSQALSFQYGSDNVL